MTVNLSWNVRYISNTYIRKAILSPRSDKDWLDCFAQIDRTILFDSDWRMTSQWLQVSTPALPAAWSHGDVSCTSAAFRPLVAVFTQYIIPQISSHSLALLTPSSSSHSWIHGTTEMSLGVRHGQWTSRWSRRAKRFPLLIQHTRNFICAVSTLNLSWRLGHILFTFGLTVH